MNGDILVKISAEDFYRLFVTIPENSRQFYSLSADYAQAMACMLGETEIVKKIQYIKENSHPDLCIPLIDLESECIRFSPVPGRKIKFKKNGILYKTIMVNDGFKILKKIRSHILELVILMCVKHKLGIGMGESKKPEYKNVQYDLESRFDPFGDAHGGSVEG